MTSSKKIGIYRNGTWYEGLYLDEVEVKVHEDYLDANVEKAGIQAFWQLTSHFENKGYEVIDHHNNPFRTTEEYTYFIEEDKDNDSVYVRYDADKRALIIGKNLPRCAGIYTTKDLIKRLLKLDDLYNDVVQIFTEYYGIREEV
jgi:hypothetical protein